MPEDVIHGRWVLAYPLCKSTSRLVFQYQFPRQIRLLPSSSSDSIPGLIIYYKFLQVVLDHICINERPCWLSRSSPSSSSPASIQSESTADPWRTGTTARADDRSIAEQEIMVRRGFKAVRPPEAGWLLLHCWQGRFYNCMSPIAQREFNFRAKASWHHVSSGY
jgi:hypothetical protein